MKTIGIKLADGSFYPVLQENLPSEKSLDLTTAHNNQTKVMVDLYRSELCTMDDAEYVDSLEIDGLNAHPNGEPDISFIVSIDDENKLSAKIVDEETGSQSGTTISLVSRTEEERLVTDEYGISDTPQKETSDDLQAADGIAGAGLLATAEALRRQEKEKNRTDVTFTPDGEEYKSDFSDEPVTEEETFVLEETPEVEESAADEKIVEEETLIVETPAAENDFVPEEETSGLEETLEVENNLAADEIAEEETAEEETAVEEPFSSDDLPSFDDLDTSASDVQNDSDDLPSFDDLTTEDTTSDEASTDSDFTMPSDDTINAELDDSVFAADEDSPVTEEEASVEEPFSSDDLPNFDDLDTSPSDVKNDSDDLPSFDDLTTEDTTSDEASTESDFTMPSDDTINAELDDSVFAADEDSPATEEETAVEEPFSSDDLPNFDDLDTSASDAQNDSYDLPSFDDLTAAMDNTTLDSEDAIFSDDEITTSSLDNSDDFDLPDDTDLPDFPIGDETLTDSNDDDIFSDFDDSPSPASGLSFTGLYDKETEMGESSEYSEEQRKKTKVPVIICIICAIICILATLFVLFIIPSKYNLRNKKHTETVQIVKEEVKAPTEEKVLESEPLPKEEKVPPAKEDEIVVIEKAEEVVPEPPAPIVEKPKDITYKVKWGDTLWDIADTYYKNPWRYKYLARYNGIKNPDYIVSGTVIVIPAE